MKHKDGQILIVMGLLLIAAALFLCAGNLLESRRAQQASQTAVRQLRQYRVLEATAPQPTEGILPEAPEELSTEMPEVMVDGRAYIGTLSIPSLELELGILSQCTAEGLKTAPCRYTGGVSTRDLVICAHNYPGHFGKIEQLLPGESLFLTDAEGKRYEYLVDALEVLPPDGVEEMAESSWELTLFTCTPGGKERLTVRCRAAG